MPVQLDSNSYQIAIDSYCLFYLRYQTMQNQNSRAQWMILSQVERDLEV